MDYKEILEIVLSSLILPLIIYGLTQFHRFITQKINQVKDQRTRDALHEAYAIVNDAVTTAVIDTEQTFVKALKKADKWDKIAMRDALNITKNKVTKIADDSALELIAVSTGFLDEYLTSKIEEAVNSDYFFKG